GAHPDVPDSGSRSAGDQGAAHDVGELGEITRVPHIDREGADCPDVLRGGRQETGRPDFAQYYPR
uniref:hypothetical protein n=1 Tax=Nocardia gamkensis TaxID=352869 RepID=UPI000AB11B76